MEQLIKCFEQIPRKRDTVHSYIIEWLLEKMKQV